MRLYQVTIIAEHADALPEQPQERIRRVEHTLEEFAAREELVGLVLSRGLGVKGLL